MVSIGNQAVTREFNAYMGVCQDLSGFRLWPVEAGGIPGPQLRGTGGTLGVVLGRRDLGYPPC